MPNCFQLTRKGETEATPLNTIDAELCGLFNRPVDDIQYCSNWYNIIGFALACGQSLEQIKSTLIEQKHHASVDYGEAAHYSELIVICNYLIANYTSDAWAEIGRR